jgi:hypothetical protein
LSLLDADSVAFRADRADENVFWRRAGTSGRSKTMRTPVANARPLSTAARVAPDGGALAPRRSCEEDRSLKPQLEPGTTDARATAVETAQELAEFLDEQLELIDTYGHTAAACRNPNLAKLESVSPYRPSPVGGCNIAAIRRGRGES